MEVRVFSTAPFDKFRRRAESGAMSETDHRAPHDGDFLGAEALTSERMEAVAAAIAAADKPALLAEIAEFHESDVAEMIALLPPDARAAFTRLVGADIPAAVFAELDEGVRDEVVEHLDLETLIATIQALESDDAVGVLEDVDLSERAEILERIPETDRLVLERSLDFPEDSAGRLMQSGFVAVPPYWTVGRTIDHLRETEDLPDSFLEIIIVDPMHKPVGVVKLDRILRTQRPVAVGDVIDADFTLIPATTDREEVARLFERYNLVSAAVVDENQRMLGVITADDVIEVIADEAGEDILLLGGVGDEAVTDTVLRAARGRFSWLFVNLATAIAASVVIALFDASIEQMVALAILMPIVASMGGNAGTQTLTITVRSLATQDIIPLNARRAIYRELGIGFINGAAFAAIVGLVGAFWFDDVPLGVVLAAAMIANMVVAAAAGILVPIGLHRARIDPAVASGVFVTTVTDVIGFFAFLGFATIFLLA